MTQIARQAVGQTQTGSGMTTTWPKATSKGSLLLLDVCWNGGTDVNAHVPAGWVLLDDRVDQTTGISVATYAMPNAPSQTGGVQVSLVLSSDDSTATTRYFACFLTEYPGMAISSYTDGHAPAHGSSQLVDTGATSTTTVNNDVAHCVAAHANAPTAAQLAANSTGYTLLVEKYSGSTGTDRIDAGIYEKQLGASGSTFQFTTAITGSFNRAWAVNAYALKPVSTVVTPPSVPCAQGLFRAGATSLESDRLPPVMNGITVYPDWSALEASNTGALNGSAVAMIDNAVTYCNANSLQLKLRVFVNGNNAAGGGSSCPSWLMSLCGTFKHANSQHPTSPETMARFWVQPFLDHYDRLMQLMSSRWDANACLVDVTISLPMMKYAEPLIRDLPIAANRAELVGGGNGFNGKFIPTPGAGYSDALAIAAIKAGMDTHAAYWPNTCSSFAYNPYQSLTSYSVFDVNDDAQLSQTKALMDYHRQVLGPQAVLENNSVRTSYFTYDGSGAATGLANTGSYQLMYAAMIQRGAPLFFQTATSSRIGDMSQTMDGIINVLNGNAVEPPTDYESIAAGGGAAAADYKVAAFTSYNAGLIANPTGAGTTSVVNKTASDTGHGSDSQTLTVITANVVTKTDTDAGSGTDAEVLTLPTTSVSNPSGHKPAKRS